MRANREKQRENKKKKGRAIRSNSTRGMETGGPFGVKPISVPGGVEKEEGISKRLMRAPTTWTTQGNGGTKERAKGNIGEGNRHPRKSYR